MPNTTSEKIFVLTAPPAVRGNNWLSLPVDVETLSEAIKKFVGQIQSILDNAPMEFNHFELSELTVSAEISADGKLSILGSGVEIGSKGGIEFKFGRKRNHLETQ